MSKQKPIHVLKTWPRYFQDLQDGVKTFELRENDRQYAKGDYLWLREWGPANSLGDGDYSGRELFFQVGYVFSGRSSIALHNDYVILSLLGVDIQQIQQIVAIKGPDKDA